MDIRIKLILALLIGAGLGVFFDNDLSLFFGGE